MIDRQLAGIDDAHVHARLYGMVEKHRVYRLAHRIVAAEGERHIGYAAGYEGVRQAAFDFARGLDKVHGIVVVFLYACGHGENIWIENNVLGREADDAREDVIATGAYLYFARARVGLAGFVEGHDHHRRAVTPHQARLADEFFLAFLKADGVHHRFALHAL